MVPKNVEQLIRYNLFREEDERMVSRRVLRERNMTMGRCGIVTSSTTHIVNDGVEP